MVRKEWTHQRFGSMVITVLEAEEISDGEALAELAMYMSDYDCHVTCEETDDGDYTMTVSLSLDEDINYHIPM